MLNLNSSYYILFNSTTITIISGGTSMNEEKNLSELSKLHNEILFDALKKETKALAKKYEEEKK